MLFRRPPFKPFPTIPQQLRAISQLQAQPSEGHQQPVNIGIPLSSHSWGGWVMHDEEGHNKQKSASKCGFLSSHGYEKGDISRLSIKKGVQRLRWANKHPDKIKPKHNASPWWALIQRENLHNDRSILPIETKITKTSWRNNRIVEHTILKRQAKK